MERSNHFTSFLPSFFRGFSRAAAATRSAPEKQAAAMPSKGVPARPEPHPLLHYPIEADLAGVAYSKHQEALSQLFVGDPIALNREPISLEERNIVAVYSLRLGQRLGYIPKELAEVLGPLMMKGQLFVADVAEVIRDKADDAYGLRIYINELQLLGPVSKSHHAAMTDDDIAPALQDYASLSGDLDLLNFFENDPWLARDVVNDTLEKLIAAAPWSGYWQHIEDFFRTSSLEEMGLLAATLLVFDMAKRKAVMNTDKVQEGLYLFMLGSLDKTKLLSAVEKMNEKLRISAAFFEKMVYCLSIWADSIAYWIRLRKNPRFRLTQPFQLTTRIATATLFPHCQEMLSRMVPHDPLVLIRKEAEVMVFSVRFKQFLGYVPQEFADVVTHLMDKGYRLTVDLVEIAGGGPNSFYDPRICIKQEL
jgi:hypothetical protein